MPLSLDAIRNQIRTSIHGRRLGLDDNQQLVGVKGSRIPVNAATSDTTATTITGDGFWTVDTTTNDSWYLGPPVVGGFVYLNTGSTSTGIRTIITGQSNSSSTSWAIQSSGNSTGTTITAQGGGITLTLFGVTSALYAIVNRGPGGLASSAVSTELAIT